MPHFRMEYDKEPDIQKFGVALFEHCSNEPIGSHIDVTLACEGIDETHNILCGHVGIAQAHELAAHMLKQWELKKAAAANISTFEQPASVFATDVVEQEAHS